MATSLDQGAVNSFLRGLRYPTTRDELVHLATINRVPDDLLDALRGMPSKEYRTQQEVMDQLGKQGHRIG